jgi:hypothetical protein
LEVGALCERLRSDLRRLGLGSAEIDAISRKVEPLLVSDSAEQYGALLAGVAAGVGCRDDFDPHFDSPRDVADVERLMHGVREEVQKLDEGLRMLSAYVTGLRRRSQRRSQHRTDDTLH